MEDGKNTHDSFNGLILFRDTAQEKMCHDHFMFTYILRREKIELLMVLCGDLYTRSWRPEWW